MKLHIASSWRNEFQSTVVEALRKAGHECYDFKNPSTGTGFAWSQISKDWQRWTLKEYRAQLWHSLAESGFRSDFEAMKWADAGVLVLPCGRSAHLEAGYFVGAGKPLYILLSDDKFEPELMYKMATSIALTLPELLTAIGR